MSHRKPTCLLALHLDAAYGDYRMATSSEFLPDLGDARHAESVFHLQDIVLGSGPCFSQDTDSVGARRISTDIP